MSTPLISVIVPVYNTEQYLRRCLDSIADQTYKNLEIICIDDGSVDASGAILDEYAAKDARFKVIHKPNGGQAAARNDALDIATGDYIANVDSDDYLELHAYETVARHLADDIDMVWIGNHVVCDFDDNFKASQERFYKIPYEGKRKLPYASLSKMSGAVWNKIIRRDLLEKYQIRYPEGVIFEDLCYFAQASAIINNVYFLPDKLYFYLQREDSTMGQARTKESSKSRDVLKIITPMCEFYSKWDLFKSHRALFESYFAKFYSLATKFLPDDIRQDVAQEAFELARMCGFGKDGTQKELLEAMMKQAFGEERIQSYRFLGIKFLHIKRKWNYSAYRLLGIKVCEMHISPYFTAIRTPFYSVKSRKKAYRIFGIPFYTVTIRDGVLRKKLFGITLLKKKLPGFKKAAVEPKKAAQAPVQLQPKPQAPIHVPVTYLEPSTKLKGRKVIVTGGGRGLGFSMAEKFVAEGAEVLIAGRNAELLKSKAEELNCKFLPLDVQDVSEFSRFINHAGELLGGIDCLVNNAGVSIHEGNIRKVEPEGFDMQFNTNLRGSYFLTKEFIKYLQENNIQGGQVLFISSERGFFVDDIPYGLTKVAINSLVKTLSLSPACRGMRINGIAPGITSSDMTGYKADGNLYCAYNANKRVYLPEEVAEAAAFLLSDDANCINGQIFACDEGRTITPHWKRP